MIVVGVQVLAKPGRREDLIRMAQGMIAPSRAEAGCISYNFFADTLNPEAFFYFEEWESREALEAHTRTPHFINYSAGLPEVLARPSQIRIYDVAG